jgi:hypothetical protein
MAEHLLKIAVVYLVIGVGIGIWMGIAADFALTPVHVHVLLLGWVTLALAAFVYHAYPAAAATRLARAHFWLHNLVLPVFMGALALFRLGHAQLLPVLIAASLAMFVALALFAWNVLGNVKAGAPAAAV